MSAHVGTAELVLLLPALVLPALVLLLLEIWLPLKNMTAATISQGLVAECVTLHIWPCGQLGRKIGVAIKTFNILLYSSFLAWTIANPGPKWKCTFATDSEADVKLYQSWEIATSARLQISAILCLVIGWTSFPLLVWQLFHQNKYVTSIVGAHLSKGKEKNTEEEKEEGVLPATNDVGETLKYKLGI